MSDDCLIMAVVCPPAIILLPAGFAKPQLWLKQQKTT